MDSVGPGNAVGNINAVRFTAASGPTPFGGTPIPLPGRVQAENFDNGGEGVAYHDESAGNNGGAYRSTDVDIETTAGGYDVGWVASGEWLNYSVSVASAGHYTISFRVASFGAGGTFHLEMNGVDVTGPLTIPDTGDWQQLGHRQQSCLADGRTADGAPRDGFARRFGGG